MLSTALGVVLMVSVTQHTVVAQPEPSPEDGATAQSQETGQPAVVPGSVTETSQVVAEPDGGFKLETFSRPVRVNRAGDWVDVDTTLQPSADGRLAPVASTADVTFSPGGSGPLITMREGEQEVAISWPTALPTPVIDGNKATYPDVFPDVDLTVLAQSDGFSEVLVVKSAAAAANPALRDIRLDATTEHLELTKAENGALVAQDSEGETVFTGSTPVMWDSTVDGQTGSLPSVEDTGSGQVSALGIDVVDTASGAVEITVAPPVDALVGADVTYPLFIDPSMSNVRTHWLQVTTAGWSHYDTDNNAGVGYCSGWPGCGPAFRARSFFVMNISPLMKRNGHEPRIFRADFYATQVHGAHSCTAEPVDLYVTGAFNGSTTWPGPSGTFLERRSSGVGGQCGGPGEVRFNAAGAISLWFDANGGNPNAAPTLAFGLRAPDESNPYQWKRFGNNPRLEVLFSFPPEKPTGLTIADKVMCTGQAITSDNTPTLRAKAKDNNNPPLNTGIWFNIHKPDGTILANTPSPVVVASDTLASWTVPTAQPDGDYRMQAASQNMFPGNSAYNIAVGSALAPFPFSIHAAKPAKPTVSSGDYPRDYWGNPGDAPGTFTVDSNGAPHTVGFSYTFQGAGTEVVPAVTDCDYNRTFGVTGGFVPAIGGKAVIPVPSGLSAGYHTLHVKTFTDAHVMSTSSDKYVFYVAPPAGKPTVRLEADALTRSQPAGQNIPVTTENNCCNITWSGGKQLRFDGTAANQTLTLDVPVATAGSYRVDLRMTRSSNYAKVQFTLDGTPIGQEFDGYSPTAFSPSVVLGTRTLAAGTGKLGIRTTGKTTASTSYRFGVDQVILTPVDHRVEAESLPRDHPAGQSVTSVVEGPCCGGVYSGGSHVWFPATGADQSVDLRVTVPVEGDYALAATLTKGADHGQYRIEIDGKPLNGTETIPWNGYTAIGNRIPHYRPFGGAHLTAGQHTLTFIATGKANSATSYAIGIDVLDLVRLNGSRQTTFAEARNNQAITGAGETGNFDLDDGSLPREAMTAAGLAPGTSTTINGVAFTLPPSGPGVADNVIATGQTIPLAGKASEIGLLVAATCGSTPVTRSYLAYTDDTNSDQLFASVPDWITGDAANAVLELPYTYRDGVADHTERPKLYAVFLPVAKPDVDLESITLPYYGFQHVTGCQPSLHVLAMSLRTNQAGWVGAWAAAPDATVAPPDGAGMANTTLRVVAHPTVRGGQVRVRLANPWATKPLSIAAATIAGHTGTTGPSTGTTTPLTFGPTSATTVTIPAGGEITSNAVTNPAATAGDLAVSAHFSGAVDRLPVHKSSNARTYLTGGNRTATGDWSTLAPVELPDSYLITGIEVSDPNTANGTVVVLGDQRTGIGPATSGQRTTWVDQLPAALDPPLQGGIVNAGRAGLTATSRWRLVESSGTVAADTAGTAPAQLYGTGVTFTSDTTRSQVAAYQGTGLLATTRPIIDTTRDYSVTGWAKLTSDTGHHTIASQSGTAHGAFYLQFNRDLNAWTFISPHSDSASSAFTSVRGPANPTLNTWTHLTGTFDGDTGTMALYINGTLVGTAVNPSPFTSAGPLAVGGRKLTGGAISNYFQGSLSDVQVFERTLTARDVAEIKNGTPILDAPTAATAIHTVDRTVYSNPNVRTVVVALGANDILQATGSATEIYNTAKINLTALISSESPAGLRARVRTDATNVRVFLATIPPLGLPTTDPREQARVQLNADILNNYSTYGQPTQTFDIATALADPTHNNLIKPSYHTNGIPNADYHNQIATTITTVVNGPPPYDDF